MRRLFRRFVRQAKDDDIDFAIELLLRGLILTSLGGRLGSSTPEKPASLSLICRPVVPASPSMKIFAAMVASYKSECPKRRVALMRELALIQRRRGRMGGRAVMRRVFVQTAVTVKAVP